MKMSLERELLLMIFMCSSAKSSFELHLFRKANNCAPLFEHVNLTSRLLLTSSKRVLQRTDCPESVFVDNRNLEGSLVGLCRF